MSQQPTVHLKGSSRALLTHRPVPLYVHAQNRAGGGVRGRSEASVQGEFTGGDDDVNDLKDAAGAPEETVRTWI